MKIRISEEVKNALKNGQPVVSLESTIITHGMPYPINIQTAEECEQEIRNLGAVPATIGFVDGVCVVGMNKEEIEYIAADKTCVKVSRRDIPVVVAKGLNGGTTVATTMIVSELVGIKVFATGGIGGVHKGAQQTMDISADLDEFSKTDVCVVCAGAKAILDLELTLEYLETKGVPVLGYKTSQLPAFYSASSPFKVGYRVDSAKEIADILFEKWSIGLKGGVLVTNPIEEKYSMPYEEINKIIDVAIKELNEKHIIGKEVTPFLLGRVKEMTKGESLEANIALVKNNCRLAAQIAVEYCKHD